MPTITDNRKENAIIESVRSCDPNMKQPLLLELSKYLPSNHDVQISYMKLRELFTPDSTRQFLVRHNDILFFYPLSNYFEIKLKMIVFCYSNKIYGSTHCWINRVGCCTCHCAWNMQIERQVRWEKVPQWFYKKMMVETCAVWFRVWHKSYWIHTFGRGAGLNHSFKKTGLRLGIRLVIVWAMLSMVIQANKVRCFYCFWIVRGSCCNSFRMNLNFRKHSSQHCGIQRFYPFLIHSFSIQNMIVKSLWGRFVLVLPYQHLFKLY